MLEFVQVLATVSTAVAMTTSVAHTLELPGKLRLSRHDYESVQTIYYPGFTWAGPAEPIAIVALGVVVALTPFGSAAFWLSSAAVVAAVATHALYWKLTAPVNKVWLKDERLSGTAQRFFDSAADVDVNDWTALRDRWERSHVYRAITASTAFSLTVIALVV
jgi:hypothetical protein